MVARQVAAYTVWNEAWLFEGQIRSASPTVSPYVLVKEPPIRIECANSIKRVSGKSVCATTPVTLV